MAPMDIKLQRRDAVALIALALTSAHARAADAPPRNYAPTDDPESIAIWQKLRASVFENRPIATAAPGLLTLEVPARAIDAAVVPLAIRSAFPQTAQRYVKRLVLVIDANPSPLSGLFAFSPANGRVEIETRVRVDAYSWVRAIAELDDGSLHAVTKFVKASGGCSAPAGSDAQAALANLGRMRFRIDGDVTQRSQPVQAQLVIDHPNHSGLAMDQLTRLFTPAHFVRKVDVSLGNTPVFSADVDFSIAENPNFRFWFVPDGRADAQLNAVVVDSQERRFTASHPLRAA
jgi:sulfur-oxidizing protein SoxY